MRQMGMMWPWSDRMEQKLSLAVIKAGFDGSFRRIFTLRLGILEEQPFAPNLTR